LLGRPSVFLLQPFQQPAGVVLALEFFAEGHHRLDLPQGFPMPPQGIERDGDMIADLGLAVGARLCIAQ